MAHATVDVNRTADTVHRQRLQALGEIAAAVSPEVNNSLAAALGTLDLIMQRQDLRLDLRRDLSGCRTHLWRIAATLGRLTDVQGQTTEYVGPDRMTALTPDA
jgi:C4-dicarboxylate-specific signal transduction histidine kinase